MSGITVYLSFWAICLLFFLNLGPCILKADSLVEYEMAGIRVRVNGIVAEALELEMVACLGALCKPWLNHNVVEQFQGVGVE